MLTIQQIQHDVTLLVLQDRENHFKTALKQAGINIICLDVKNVYNPFITFKFAKILRKKGNVNMKTMIAEVCPHCENST